MHPLAMSRRRLLGAAAIGVCLTLFPALAAAAPQGARPAFRLPAPTGPHAVTWAYAGAFFDLHLHGIGSPLLDAASPRYPEVRSVA